MNQDTYEISIWLKGNEQPIRYDALAAYQQGQFYCVAYYNLEGQKRVRKWPLIDIWAVDAEYKYVSWKPTATQQA